MPQDLRFLSDTIKSGEIVSADSTAISVIELISNPISVRNDADNWGFILFFICFFVITNVINQKGKFLVSMVSILFRNKERHSIFYETVAYESLHKLLLSFQTILLFSIILYCLAIHEQYLLITSFAQMFLFIGKNALILSLFFLYKFLTYSLAGIVFFKKETVRQWNDDFFSLISLNGIFLYFPVLILFYVESAYSFCIHLIGFYLVFIVFFIFYKLYTLFFHHKRLFLYFILYLCTQEIIPLYLVYRGLVYLMAQKDTLWI
jgi:hypothetical protein